MTILNQLQHQNNFTETEKNLALFLLNHKEDAAGKQIKELATMTYTSISAISRFCKKLGLKSFKEFYVQFAKEVALFQNTNQPVDINFPFQENETHFQVFQDIQDLYIQSIQDTFSYFDVDVINHVVQILYNAQTIDMYAVTNNLSTALSFQNKMQMIRKYVNVSLIPQSQRFMALASDQSHVAILLSYSGKTPEMVLIGQLLKQKGITTILITQVNDSPLLHLCDYVLNVSSKENLNHKISHYASHISTQFVLDCLYSCLFKRDYQKNLDYIFDQYNQLDPRINNR